MGLRAVTSLNAGGSGNVVASGTYANMPAAASFSGQLYYASDLGPSGIYIYSNGTNTYPAWPQVFDRFAGTSSVTGTTSETALRTTTIPANLLGINGGIYAMMTATQTNSGNNKTLRLRLGGISGTAFYNLAQSTISQWSSVCRFRNAGAANSQQSGSNPGATAGLGALALAYVTGAVDTTAAQDVVVSGELATSGETFSLREYDLWVLP